ncbi:hypothetical protein N9V06_03890 [SAR86 cluster bacterium]|nr:hypothetical protein [SAR86 cluster bacterium]
MVPPLSDKIKKSALSPSITKRALPDALPLFSSIPESSLKILKELECKNIMIQGSDPAETKGLISYFLKIGKENLGIFRSNDIKIYKDPGSEVII